MPYFQAKLPRLACARTVHSPWGASAFFHPLCAVGGTQLPTPIPVFLQPALPLSKQTDLDGAIGLWGAGPTVRLPLQESREIRAWHDHPRGALIDHGLSQKDVVVFKPPNFGDVHAAALSLMRR